MIAAICVVALLARIVLIHLRWINPDEGAHLMDGRFILQGLTPYVDYNARMPFYIYLIALFLKLFGIGFSAGRLLPVFASVAGGWMIYLIAKRLWNESVGLTSASFYLFIPLSLIWSPVVKEETVGVFFCCLAVYILLLGVEKKSSLKWMILAGIFSAIAYYSRASMVYIPVIAVLILYIKNQNNFVKRFLQYCTGYLVIVLGCFFYFIPKMTFSDFMSRSLNPLFLVWNRLFLLLGVLPETQKITDDSGFRILGQDFALTTQAWQNSLVFCLFLMAAVVLLLISKNSNRDKTADENTNFVVGWAGIILFFYLLQSANRGFFSQYFVEAIPALSITAAVFLERILGNMNILKKLAMIWIPFYLFFLVQWRLEYTIQIEMVLAFSIIIMSVFSWFILKQRKFIIYLLMVSVLGFYFIFNMFINNELFCIIISMVFYYYLSQKFNNIKVRIPGYLYFILFFTFVYSALYSGRYIEFGYMSVWSPKTVRQVTRLLHEEGNASDQVISGGTIWPFEANMQPYLNIPHPTEFVKKYRPEFEKQFIQNRPQFVVLDGYTHRKFERYWTFIKEQVQLNYKEIGKFEGSRYPVVVYKLNPTVNNELTPALAGLPVPLETL